MTIVFDEFELDAARRELRVQGKVRALQPQVFDLLLYLVENRERVVPKHELLEALWPETTVTESSIQ
jgi:DNA-binding winged helix-turn-helix (wHTH) protein